MSLTKDYDSSRSSGGPIRRDMPQMHAQNPPIVVEEILPEEREFFRNCIYGTVIKCGLPFAVVFHYLTKFAQSKAVKQVSPKPFSLKPVMFFGNVIIGSLIFSPICVQKLKILHEENKKNRNEMLTAGSSTGEGVFSSSSASEDFSYPSDIISSLNEPESSFSSDFSTSSLLNNEEEKKILSTTYEDLRTQHRSGTFQSNKSPPSHLNIEPQQHLDPLSAPVKSSTFNEPPSPRRVTKKNKYGDEME